MIVVVHQGALGDWVMTFPILRALPREPVALVTAPTKGNLAKRVRPIDAVHAAESAGWSRLFAAGASADDVSLRRDGVVETLGLASLVMSFVSDGRDAWASNARSLAPDAKLVFVAPRPPSDWADHVAEWHRAQLRAQGVAMPASVLPRERHNPGGAIVIHPGSGGRDKCWPIDRFESLIESLITSGCHVKPVLGEVEMERWNARDIERWKSSFHASVIESLDGLADELTRARLFIGNDSGPTHLAAQLGVPTLALFGPTPPAIWKPIGPRVRVIAPHELAPMTWLCPEACLAAAMKTLTAMTE